LGRARLCRRRRACRSRLAAFSVITHDYFARRIFYCRRCCWPWRSAGSTAFRLLPFVLIDGIGLSPLHYALVMLIQTGSFIAGNLVATRLTRRFDGPALIRVGLGCLIVSGLGFAVLPRLFPDSVLAVMTPVGFWMLALATIGPSATASAMARFGHIAGAAGALTGFFQMGGGFLASLLAIGLFPDAHEAVATLLPVLAVLAIATALQQGRLTARRLRQDA
jgi:DHA1 family bicyclomycin/chloramphenicol resistance-like MFS transporter